MKSVCCKTLALTALVAAPLWAQAELTANIALTSNYKFRGQDQDQKRTSAVKPALQGGFDYSFGDSGFYIGNWNSSVNWMDNNSLETDFYGGYKFKAAGIDWDAGALTYVYPGSSKGNTTELYGAGTYGPFTAKYSHTISKDYFGMAKATGVDGARGRNTGYLQLAYSQEVVKSLTLKASLGFVHLASDIRTDKTPNYVDYSLGAAYDFGGGLSLTGAVVGANKKAYYGNANKARLIVTLAKTL
jgi:uncharacterized protein (TIGR02001 family)